MVVYDTVNLKMSAIKSCLDLMLLRIASLLHAASALPLVVYAAIRSSAPLVLAIAFAAASAMTNPLRDGHRGQLVNAKADPFSSARLVHHEAAASSGCTVEYAEVKQSTMNMITATQW